MRFTKTRKIFILKGLATGVNQITILKDYSPPPPNFEMIYVYVGEYKNLREKSTIIFCAILGDAKTSLFSSLPLKSWLSPHPIS